MRTLNLGILAHIDAGKTSLTERLLFDHGVIDEVGSVDAGSTQTDSLALERRRGITIRSAVVSFAVGDVTVNLIDTPGHPDFIAEVERVLGVLDGAVLVVSAVEGVQAQTRILMRALRRLGIPTLIFVNKVDRAGARTDALVESIRDTLSAGAVPLGRVRDLGTRAATYEPGPPTDGLVDAASAAALVDVLASHDDALLADYVTDPAAVTAGRLRRALAAQTARCRVHPVLFGSAITGTGASALTGAVTTLLPAAPGDADAPVSATVFKVERGPAGEKIAYARMFAGTLRVRDAVTISPAGEGSARSSSEAKVTAIGLFADGGATPAREVSAGRIAKLWGLSGVRVGDTIGAPPPSRRRQRFAPPSLETVVVPRRPGDKGRLHAALAQLAEQDPLIDLRLDDLRGEIAVSLYGEVQKEVIEATLAEEFGVEVAFQGTTTICVERPVGTGEAFEVIAVEPNPFLATVGLRVEPVPDAGRGSSVGAAVVFRLGIELGSLPIAFIKAVEETVHETLRQGLHGWAVTGCVVTLVRSGYWARQSHSHGTFDKSMSSTAGDFRSLTPLVLMAALRQAKTQVYEPMHRFRLEVPDDVYGAVVPVLTSLRAYPESTVAGRSSYVLEGVMPAELVHDLERKLPSLTRGEGVLETAFDHYAEVAGEPPSRPRTDHNPLNRKEYLLHVVRRV